MSQGTGSKKDAQATEALQALLDGPATPPASRCAVDWLYEQMSPSLSTALQEAFKRPGIPIAKIHQTIGEANYPITYGQVARHARAIRGTGGTTCKCQP